MILTENPCLECSFRFHTVSSVTLFVKLVCGKKETFLLHICKKFNVFATRKTQDGRKQRKKGKKRKVQSEGR
jgi:hypothetical protein